MRSHAQAVVIGGGVVGCSVLYHLIKMGWKDVVLLERLALTSGSRSRRVLRSRWSEAVSGCACDKSQERRPSRATTPTPSGCG
ncbi:MAG: FAD-dependent oxidoreductase, partial [Pseudomonadota bacterium]